MPLLRTPYNVATTVAGKNIKVSWKDSNPPAKVDKFAIAFLERDTLLPFKLTAVPTTPPVTGTAPPYENSVEITPPDGTLPSDLSSKDIAQVIAKAKAGDAEYTDSEPGLQAYWSASLSLVVQVGSHSFTLTKSSGVSGIYRLPVSRTKPFTITLDDVKEFAISVGVDPNNVPTKWPDGSDIKGALNLYKLAVDTDLSLFALEIAVTLDFSPIAGLIVHEVGLSVVRTNGINTL